MNKKKCLIRLQNPLDDKLDFHSHGTASITLEAPVCGSFYSDVDEIFLNLNCVPVAKTEVALKCKWYLYSSESFLAYGFKLDVVLRVEC